MSDAAALVRRLRSPRRIEQRQAALAIEELCLEDPEAACEALVAAGCLPALLALLRGSPLVQAPAAAALGSLTAHSAAARAASVDAVPTLVGLLAAESEELQSEAALVLSNLAAEDAGRSAITAADGLTALLRLTASSDALAQQSACHTLFNLAALGSSACDAVGAALRDAGALPALVAVLQRFHDSSSSSWHAYTAAGLAAHTIGRLCASAARQGAPELEAARGRAVSAAAAAQAATAGAPAALVQLLRSSSADRVLQGVSYALAVLAVSDEPSVLSAIVAAGGLRVVAERVATGGYGGQFLGRMLTVLRRLSDGDRKRCTAVAAVPGLLPRLIQLLGQHAGAGATADYTPDVLAGRAAGLLATLAGSSPGKPLAAAMVAAGAAPMLETVLRTAGGSDSPPLGAVQLSRYLASQGQAPALLAAGVDAALQPLAARHELAAAVRQELLDHSRHAAAAGSTAAPAATAAAAEPTNQQPPRQPRICAAPGCGATHGLRLCGGCGSVRYCSEACSRAHWRAHRADCRRLQAEQAAAAVAATGPKQRSP